MSAIRRPDRGSRLWWAAPLALVTATGATFAVLGAPALADRVTVPAQLAGSSDRPSAPAHQHRHGSVRPRPAHPKPRSSVRPVAPAPAVTAPVAIAPTPQPHVVAPSHPVVHESDDGSGYDGGHHRGGPSDDGSQSGSPGGDN